MTEIFDKGFKKCPEWLRDSYRDAVKHRCQICHFHEKSIGKLEIHRIKRGLDGGLYTVCRLSDKDNNIKVVCKDCHKDLHKNEYSHIKSK